MKKLLLTFLTLASISSSVTAFARPKVSLSVGSERACVVVDAQVHCWGKKLPGEGFSLDRDYSEVAVSDVHVCAIYGPRYGVFGGACLSDTERQIDFPRTNVTGFSNPRGLVSSSQRACFFDDNGFYCTFSSWPTQRPGITNLFLGEDNDCLKESGELQCNGPDAFPTNAYSVASEIGFGALHTCAILENKLKCWVHADFTYLELPELKNPRNLSVSHDTTCVIDDDGGHCWGLNGNLIYPQAIALKTFNNTVCAVDEYSGITCTEPIGGEMPPSDVFSSYLTPNFNLKTMSSYLKDISVGSSPARSAIFTEIAQMIENELENNYDIIVYERPEGIFFIASLLAPTIKGTDTEYYVKYAIPGFENSMNKILKEGSYKTLKKDVKHSEINLRLALKIIKTTLTTMQNYLEDKDDKEVQKTLKVIDVAIADQTPKKMQAALKNLKDLKPVYGKLTSPAKISFMGLLVDNVVTWLEETK